MFNPTAHGGPPDPMLAYRAKRDTARQSVLNKYTILGFISSGNKQSIFTFLVHIMLTLRFCFRLLISLFFYLGTYGRVYKAQAKPTSPSGTSTPNGSPKLYAIKKFKPDKEGEAATYTGLSQSAIREISLNRELSGTYRPEKRIDARGGDEDKARCENIARLLEVILEDKSIYMVFEYAEHDFLVSWNIPLTKIPLEEC